MEKFKEMLLKKKAQQKGKVDPSKLEAKANIMRSLSDELGKDISEDLKGLKKVTVASDSEEGLKEGLEKAEDVLEGKEEESNESEMENEEEGEESESSDDLQSKIAELEKQLEELKKRA
jgi:hypothetical protein